MLPALAWAFASSSLIYVATPRIPVYQVQSLSLRRVAPSSLFPPRLSATVRAGLEVTNANFVGADVHAAAMDIYYPDWHGDLQHIGTMRDTNAVESSPDAAGYETAKDAPKSGSVAGGAVGFAYAAEMDAGAAALARPSSPSQSPILTVPARQITASEADLVSMFLHDVGPKTYLNMLWDLVTSFGKIEILTSGIVHVKQPLLSLPLAVGIVCDNTIDLLSLPWRVEGRNCAVQDVGAGWSEEITERGGRLRERILRSHRDTGRVLDRRRAENDDGVREIENDMEHLVEWHAF